MSRESLERDALRVGLLFKLLATPGRVKLLLLLRSVHGDSCCVGALAEVLEVNPTTVSLNLRGLRLEGLVAFERQGRHVAYSLSARGEKLLDAVLEAASGEPKAEPEFSGEIQDEADYGGFDLGSINRSKR